MRTLRPGPLGDPTAAAKYALRALARRYRQLTVEIQDLVAQLDRLTRAAAPALVGTFGVGPDTVATLLVTAGSNPERLHSEASFAALCGVNPIAASSGKTHRHRLNRGGDRQANAALYRIVLVRLRYDHRTKAYMRRRTGEGMSKTEVIRCLKRYVAREVFALLREFSPRLHSHFEQGCPDSGVVWMAHPCGKIVLGRAEDRATLGSDPSADAGAVRIGRAYRLCLSFALPIRQHQSAKPRGAGRAIAS